MKLLQSEDKASTKEKLRFRRVVAQIKSVTKTDIEVEAGKENSKPRLIRVPIQPAFVQFGFSWMPGDWVQIKLKNVTQEEQFDADDISANFTKQDPLLLAIG